jgi:hypothetical protein
MFMTSLNAGEPLGEPHSMVHISSTTPESRPATVAQAIGNL